MIMRDFNFGFAKHLFKCGNHSVEDVFVWVSNFDIIDVYGSNEFQLRLIRVFRDQLRIVCC